jgi:DNA-binding NarL/FixJ family response regulator
LKNLGFKGDGVYKILLVEDNAPFRKSLREVLHNRFPQVLIEEAGNGKETLEKMDSFCPSMIFMDIRLPDANGLELTQKIKGDCPETVIIILTSYDLPEYREAAEKYGANHFMTKGALTEEEIVAKVNIYYKE